jgi:signal transduction histidine kinase
MGTRIEALQPALGAAKRVEVELPGPDGRGVAVDVSAARVPMGSSELVIAIARDLSERRAAEVERRRLNDDASRARRARDELLGTASLELDFPLALLGRQIDLLAAENPPLAARLAAARVAVNRIARTVDLVGVAARPPEDATEGAAAECDFAAIVRDVAKCFENEAGYLGSAIEVSALEPVLGHWDAKAVDRIASVLIAHALRRGGGKPLAVAVEKLDDAVRLTVVDAASGVAVLDAARTLDEPGESGDGAPGGLGLWVARRIVEAAHGTLTVSTRRGEGSAVCVTLPHRRTK